MLEKSLERIIDILAPQGANYGLFSQKTHNGNKVLTAASGCQLFKWKIENGKLKMGNGKWVIVF
jgi:hypothetical protein